MVSILQRFCLWTLVSVSIGCLLRLILTICISVFPCPSTIFFTALSGKRSPFSAGPRVSLRSWGKKAHGGSLSPKLAPSITFVLRWTCCLKVSWMILSSINLMMGMSKHIAGSTWFLLEQIGVFFEDFEDDLDATSSHQTALILQAWVEESFEDHQCIFAESKDMK